MGILNVTPDSFYDGGRYEKEEFLLNHVEHMLAEGAAIIDVGGYSSRPGASNVPVEAESKRVIDSIKKIRKHFADCVISVDTFRAAVARAACHEGAQLVNDISGGDLDKEMHAAIAELNIPFICMHMKGNPATMKDEAVYENLLLEVTTYFHKKIDLLHALGVKDVILDPGFGFAKTADQNFQILKALGHFRIFEKPVLVGLSRKSMIWKTLGTTPDDALNGTTALHMAALLQGASILRVHDVKEAVETIKLFSNLSPAH